LSVFDPKRFGRELRNAREQLDLTQREMTVRSRTDPDDPATGISLPYWSALERMERTTRPSEFYLDAISRALRHSDLWIVRGWAGLERMPDYSTTLRAINRDQALTDGDKVLFRNLYLRLAGRQHEEEPNGAAAHA
jgi:transcriptional regulator with XRE-family HTH domain